jgi:subtilisin family serine protease
MKKTFFLAIAVATLNTSFAQDLKTKYNWHNLDYQQDGLNGMSTEKAYQELLKGRTSKTVIVGVIDSGIDINHEDLKSVIWVNTNEIPGNGKDDDNNGFIDDINGWDFLGGSDGKDIKNEQLETLRLVLDFKTKYGENPKRRVIKKHKEEYNIYKSYANEVKEKLEEAKKILPRYQKLYDDFLSAETLLKKHLSLESLGVEQVQNLDEASAERNVRQAKQFWLQLTSQGATLEDIKEGVDHYSDQINYDYNPDFRPRKTIINDDLSKLEYGSYGNNEVQGPDALHGTHVAGIIAADRKNGIGAMGVADNVKIMTIRCVPNGDERDKDVANAIRYAVDNGAQIINMSFGKALSPEKKWVDESVKYAESKGVLLVSAAGNDNVNVDEKVHYPVRVMLDKTIAPNWITVGASNFEEAPNLAADFSNYGKKGVDVFAPGVAIYSTVTGSKYRELQGTSMASPAVTGVAALLKSYFPSLSASEIRSIILESAQNLSDQKVNLPGTNSLVKFGELSQTGSIVNAYNAIKMAIEKTK